MYYGLIISGLYFWVGTEFLIYMSDRYLELV
jgi:hypothetical protein